MIQATARVLKNQIEVRVGDATWMGRPVEAEQQGVGHRIRALFSTEYHVYRPDQSDAAAATVSYRPKSDEMRIQVGEESWKTKSTTFGPLTIEYAGATYTINERLTGRFGVLDGTRIVATGQLGFRSCVIRDYPPTLETFLAYLALGYVIRTLTWEMFG